MLPERWDDFRDGVDSDTIKSKGINDSLDPAEEIVSNEGIVLIKISKSSESAVLDVVHVLRIEIIVGDNAIAVVVTSIIERNVLRVILVDISHVVSNNVNHNPDVLFVASINE